MPIYNTQSEPTARSSTGETGSPWRPFRYKPFTVMWAATVVSFVGCWMYTAASGWLMTDLTSSSLLVSLVQAAASLAIFLFALPAGALADIVNRRKYLIACERDLGAGRKHRWTAVRTLFIAAASALITIPLTGRWKLETGPVWI